MTVNFRSCAFNDAKVGLVEEAEVVEIAVPFPVSSWTSLGSSREAGGSFVQLN